MDEWVACVFIDKMQDRMNERMQKDDEKGENESGSTPMELHRIVTVVVLNRKHGMLYLVVENKVKRWWNS